MTQSRIYVPKHPRNTPTASTSPILAAYRAGLRHAASIADEYQAANHQIAIDHKAAMPLLVDRYGFVSAIGICSDLACEIDVHAGTAENSGHLASVLRGLADGELSGTSIHAPPLPIPASLSSTQPEHSMTEALQTELIIAAIGAISVAGVAIAWFATHFHRRVGNLEKNKP